MTHDVPVERLLLPAMVARLDPEREGAITGDEIAAALAAPLRLRSGQAFRRGDALLVDTCGRQDRFFSRESAIWMAEQGVALVGATLALYDTGFANPTGVFVEWFRAAIPIIAGLQNITRIAADRVFLIVLPLAIERVCTAPCRAIVIEGEPGEVEWLAQRLRSGG